MKINQKDIREELSHMSKQDLIKMAKNSDHETQSIWDLIAKSMKE